MTEQHIVRRYDTNEAIALTFADGAITAIDAATSEPSCYLLPALCDIQVNGCLGISFNSPKLTIDDIHRVTTECQSHGIGWYLPTLITGSYSAIHYGFNQLSRALDHAPQLAETILGFHLEGPYLSDQVGARGAHPVEHLRNFDWDEFQRWQEAAQGRIRIVTLAPERLPDVKEIDRLTQSGIVVAIGHTLATPDQMRAAIDHGAQLGTHLYNGCPELLHRHNNPQLIQLADPRLSISIIPDGDHLPPHLLNAILQLKDHDKIIATADTGSLAGLPAGIYEQWGTQLQVCDDGRLIVPGTPYLAGSGRFLDHCLKVLQQAGLSYPDLARLTSLNPLRLLGHALPIIEVGCRSKWLLLGEATDSHITIQKLIP